jgi:hypothetical protein
MFCQILQSHKSINRIFYIVKIPVELMSQVFFFFSCKELRDIVELTALSDCLVNKFKWTTIVIGILELRRGIGHTICPILVAEYCDCPDMDAFRQ